MTKNFTIYPTDSFHIGNRIKAELRRQGHTITWLAEEVHCTRENFYKIFRHPWINTDMLFKISHALNHDFFRDCSVWWMQERMKDAKSQDVTDNDL